MRETEVDGTWITIVRQHPERSVPDRAHEFLAAGYVAHVGFEQDGRPYVIPMLYQYSAQQPDRLYLHGGLPSRMLQQLASGIPVCATVTELDGTPSSGSSFALMMEFSFDSAISWRMAS